MLKTIAKSIRNCAQYNINKEFRICSSNRRWQMELCDRTIATSSRQLVNTKQQPHHIRLGSDETVKEFMSVLPDVVNASTAMFLNTVAPVVAERFSKNFYYNVPTGKMFRGLTLVDSFKILQTSRTVNNDDLKLACILGWCVETMVAWFMIQDDIVDRTEMRRGKTCWYKLQDIGLHAINDSLMLDTAIYFVLKKFLSNRTSYLPIVELFHETTLRSSMGQMLDLLSVVSDRPQFDQFTMKTYASVVVNKNAYCTFILPIEAALHLAGVCSSTIHEQILPIMEKMGICYQAKDDYWDCFANYEKLGKMGTDIRNGKCTWFAVKALELVTKNQRELFEQHYGRSEANSEIEIRNLYNELEIDQVYAQWEAGMLDSIRTSIAKVPNTNSVQDVLTKAVEKFLTLPNMQ